MEERKKGRLVMRISWTQTLRNMEVDEVIEANLSERINIVRHITRISKLENKKFMTRKLGKSKMEIIRLV